MGDQKVRLSVERGGESGETRAKANRQKLEGEKFKVPGGENVLGSMPTASSLEGDLSEERLSNPANRAQLANTMLSLQKQQGNAYVQKVVKRLQASAEGQREEDSLEKTVQELQQQKGSGHPIDDETRKEMEESFGYDLGRVRIHTDEVAHRTAEALGAKAFTMGTDIFLSQKHSGNISSSEGKGLLAHELTHVVQQSQGNLSLPGDKVKMGQPGDVYEREADEVAENVVQKASGQRQPMEEEEEFLQGKLETNALQQQVEEEEEELQMEAENSLLQRQEEEEEEEIQAKFTADGGMRKGLRNLRGFTSSLNSSTIQPQWSVEEEEVVFQMSPAKSKLLTSSSKVIQTVPVDAGTLITMLEQYGRRVLGGLVDAEKEAIDDFHAELGRRADQLTGFWGMAGGAVEALGAGAAAAGPAAAEAGAAAGPIGVLGGAVAAAGIWGASEWTKAGVQRFLSESRRRCRQQAEAHGRGYEPTVISLANSFGERVAAGQEAGLRADTRDYVQIREAFRTRILQAPSTDRVYDLKWNQLCERWNDYLRGSNFWSRYTASARQLLMQRRTVRP